MKAQKFSVSDASLERSPSQDADIFVGNLVGETHDGLVTVGYGCYAPEQSLTETMALYDTIIVLEGRLSVSTGDGTVSAGAGDIVYMPKGDAVTVTTEGEGALTAYVTYPRWAEAQEG
ncbi:AraC family ligand binding domain-containing protein [Rhizobium sp. Leaf383]|uniref:AraC family ligand binding domain-containing protein n=1 Tax=Rhizobium sp. Leaf383 TaxID=1736357 RepID=UPI000714D608|nr:AraC family ligand binding domain-containing protein [Rhizobium sp. Leaf383]KQS76013.1 ethanolamine utilization protein [Rhizobium sp. Leaf383]